MTGHNALAAPNYAVDVLDLKWLSLHKHQFDEIMKAAESVTDIMGRLVFALVDARGEPWADYKAMDDAAAGENMSRPVVLPKEAFLRVQGLRWEHRPKLFLLSHAMITRSSCLT